MVKKTNISTSYSGEFPAGFGVDYSGPSSSEGDIYAESHSVDTSVRDFVYTPEIIDRIEIPRDEKGDFGRFGLFERFQFSSAGQANVPQLLMDIVGHMVLPEMPPIKEFPEFRVPNPAEMSDEIRSVERAVSVLPELHYYRNTLNRAKNVLATDGRDNIGSLADVRSYEEYEYLEAAYGLYVMKHLVWYQLNVQIKVRLDVLIEDTFYFNGTPIQKYTDREYLADILKALGEGPFNSKRYPDASVKEAELFPRLCREIEPGHKAALKKALQALTSTDRELGPEDLSLDEASMALSALNGIAAPNLYINQLYERNTYVVRTNLEAEKKIEELSGGLRRLEKAKKDKLRQIDALRFSLQFPESANPEWGMAQLFSVEQQVASIREEIDGVEYAIETVNDSIGIERDKIALNNEEIALTMAERFFRLRAEAFIVAADDKMSYHFGVSIYDKFRAFNAADVHSWIAKRRGTSLPLDPKEWTAEDFNSVAVTLSKARADYTEKRNSYIIKHSISWADEARRIGSQKVKDGECACASEWARENKASLIKNDGARRFKEAERYWRDKVKPGDSEVPLNISFTELPRRLREVRDVEQWDEMMGQLAELEGNSYTNLGTIAQTITAIWKVDYANWLKGIVTKDLPLGFGKNLPQANLAADMFLSEADLKIPRLPWQLAPFAARLDGGLKSTFHRIDDDEFSNKAAIFVLGAASALAGIAAAGYVRSLTVAAELNYGWRTYDGMQLVWNTAGRSAFGRISVPVTGYLSELGSSAVGFHVASSSMLAGITGPQEIYSPKRIAQSFAIFGMLEGAGFLLGRVMGFNATLGNKIIGRDLEEAVMVGRTTKPADINVEAAFAAEEVVPVQAALDHFGSGYGLLYQFNNFSSVVATLYNSDLFLGLINLDDAVPDGEKEKGLEQLATVAAQLAIIVFGAKNMHVPCAPIERAVLKQGMRSLDMEMGNAMRDISGLRNKWVDEAQQGGNFPLLRLSDMGDGLARAAGLSANAVEYAERYGETYPWWSDSRGVWVAKENGLRETAQPLTVIFEMVRDMIAISKRGALMSDGTLELNSMDDVMVRVDAFNDRYESVLVGERNHLFARLMYSFTNAEGKDTYLFTTDLQGFHEFLFGDPTFTGYPEAEPPDVRYLEFKPQ